MKKFSIIDAFTSMIESCIKLYIIYRIVYIPHKSLMVGFSKIFNKIFSTPIFYTYNKYFNRITIILMIINLSIIYNISLIPNNNKQLLVIGIYLGIEILVMMVGGLEQINEDNRVKEAESRYYRLKLPNNKSKRKTKQQIADEELLRKYGLI